MHPISEYLRRIYKEIVVGRSSVRVVLSQEVSSLDHPPIFLTGPYRSGTTLVRYIIDSHSHICCPPETDFIGALSSLLTEETYRRGFSGMGFDEDHVVQRIREFVIYFFGNYALSKGKGRWADKSPSYVDWLPFIHQLFPEAKFVMIYRHGLDQVNSFTRGGTFMHEALRTQYVEGGDLLFAASRYWVAQVEKMMDFEANHPDRCFRLTYEELCTNPERCLKALFEFLAEPWEPEVMDFYHFEHDMGKEGGRAISTKGFEISQGHYKTWPQEILQGCISIMDAKLRKLGYQDDRAKD